MNIAYFDSGTTNTRIYILADDRVIYTDEEKVGSKNSALAGDSTVLLAGLKRLYDRTLNSLSFMDTNIDAIYLSGMVSCPSGICEVEHLPTPAGRDEIRKNIFLYQETHLFCRTLRIIPGLKTIPQGVTVPPEEAINVNNVRGEEIEILGILRQYGEKMREPYLIALPGSHTQIALIRDGKIEDLLSCVTGELFAAITGNTIIGASVAGGTELIPEMVRRGCRVLQKNGFNRALYTVRSMDLFSPTTPHERKSFLEGILNAGVAQAVHAKLGGENLLCELFVYGSEVQTGILRVVFEELYPGRYTISRIPPAEAPMAVYGMLSLLEK